MMAVIGTTRALDIVVTLGNMAVRPNTSKVFSAKSQTAGRKKYLNLI